MATTLIDAQTSCFTEPLGADTLGWFPDRRTRGVSARLQPESVHAR
jgi:hypothetical protein